MTMKLERLVVIASIWLVSLVTTPVVLAQEEEEPASEKVVAAKDMPYFTGMPHYDIIEADDKEFDSYNFFDGKGCVTVEGRKFRRSYLFHEGSPSASDMQIVRNYGNAIKSRAGSILFDGGCQGVDCAENCGYRMLVAKLRSANDEIWAEIVPWGEGTNYMITVVVKEAMKQDVTASALLEALNRDGHVALYVHFDTGKASIRADSQPVLDQVGAMLKANPGLALTVEGHTDNVGTPASNKALSESRAAAVVKALAAQGIDPSRLAAVGWGQDKPVADNGAEEGRAKNRRVELVKK
jgi:OmpA-OmpF porin, OOP family